MPAQDTLELLALNSFASPTRLFFLGSLRPSALPASSNWAATADTGGVWTARQRDRAGVARNRYDS